MLMPLLFSIEDSNPEAAVSVYWEEITPSTVAILKTAFPAVEWIETHYKFSSDVTKRIGSKTLVWSQAAKEKVGDSRRLVFLDADMLVIKDLSLFLANVAGDIVLTSKAGLFPINSGVIIARAGARAAHFFELWRDKTVEVMNTPELYVQANDMSKPYGAADQMALHMILDYRPELRSYCVCSGDRQISVVLEHCEDLNETNSRPISERTRIIHYKGTWSSVLFEGGPFTRHRPKKDSWDMFVYYHRNFRRAVDVVNARTGNTFSPSHFGLVVPPYLNPEDSTERGFVYPFYWVWWHTKNLPPRLQRQMSKGSEKLRKVLFGLT